MFKILAVMLTSAFAVAALTTTTTTIATALSIEPAYAQLTKDPGASGLTPGEEPKRPGWDPNGAPEDAPGLISPTPCPACIKDFAPGQEGLEAGIIGPSLKK